jgi:hypothetical protein
MKRVARMLRHHQPLIRNWFVARGTIVSGHLKTGHSGAPQNQPADWFEKGWVWTG